MPGNSMVLVTAVMLAELQWGWLAMVAASGVIALYAGGVILLTVWLTGGFRGGK